MTLVRVLGSSFPRDVRMTTWYGEQSGIRSLLHNQPKNPEKNILEGSRHQEVSHKVTFFRICKLFSPIWPVPRYLAYASVNSQAKGHGNNPDRVEE